MPARTACVIPAYQAEATLEDVVASIRGAASHMRVVVIDDGSSDATRQVAERCADQVIGFDRNRGKGAALRAGFRTALAMGSEVVLTVDADGQHDPRYIAPLMMALRGADIAIGARGRGGSAMPWTRRVSNGLSSAVMSWCAGQSIPDGQSGFRAFRREVIERMAGVIEGDRYEYESNFLLRAVRAGYRMTFVPIPTVYPRDGVSHFRPVRDTARVAGAIGRSVVHFG